MALLLVYVCGMRITEQYIDLGSSQRGVNTHLERLNVGVKANSLKKARMLVKNEMIQDSFCFKIDRATNQREDRRSKR